VRIAAEFVTSVVDASAIPGRQIPEVALVGRSNVGKSSLINALVRQRLARTSAAPGKTRLINLYRVSDRAAWQWLQTVVEHPRVVATKIDKLPQGQRIRAVRELESVFEDAVLPVSSVTGEGLDELWKLIDRLPNSPKPHRPSPPRATPPKK
jgi:GTP-binding protein